MKLTFIGAAHEVTGSCTLIEINGAYGLVDCGMEQGVNIYENIDIPVSPGSIDFVLLTHAHIDHSGMIPKLFKDGYDGPVYATSATCSLCNIMLKDSAHIQESDAEWKTRKSRRSGGPVIEPVYTLRDAEVAIAHLRPVEYGEKRQINENVEIRFTDIGHLLGSSSIEVWLTEDGVTKKVVFSGDIGNKNQPIINDPIPPAAADYVITESTYGDRYHELPPDGLLATMASYIQRTLDRGGNVVIPAFAVGRAQEMLYFIRKIKLENLVTGHGDFPVYLDSPLANEATAVFLQCDTDCFDAEARAIMDEGVNPLVFPGLKISETAEDSKLINFDKTPKVIISASGMCEAGRIRHHLKHNLWRPECLVLFVGYQAVGTTGRSIVDGAKKVKLFGEDVAVNAEIGMLPGKSGHADKAGLIEWICDFGKKPEMVFVNHGEDQVTDNYAQCLMEEYGFKAYAPYSGTVFDLKNNVFVECPEGIRIEKKTAKQERNDSVYQRLVEAAAKLSEAVAGAGSMANKDIAKFTNQIYAIVDKLKK